MWGTPVSAPIYRCDAKLRVRKISERLTQKDVSIEPTIEGNNQNQAFCRPKRTSTRIRASSITTTTTRSSSHSSATQRDRQIYSAPACLGEDELPDEDHARTSRLGGRRQQRVCTKVPLQAGLPRSRCHACYKKNACHMRGLRQCCRQISMARDFPVGFD
jgi:hypothetical protein